MHSLDNLTALGSTILWGLLSIFKGKIRSLFS